YLRTGEHLGIFDSPEHANAYAQQLHQQQEQRTKPSPATPAPTSAAPTPDDLDPAEQAARAAGLPPGSRMFQGYSKTNADKGTAIAAQELTLNGKAGSTTDIGLRRATLAAMKNPKHMEKIAVA